MRLTVNGQGREVEEGATVTLLLKAFDLPLKGVAVELNKEIVRKDLFDSTPLREGDTVEIVHFVGGG